MEYADYKQVPWRRRSGINNIFVLLGMLGLWPFALWTALNLLTGSVYFAKRDADGYLKKWGILNTVWAVGILVFWGYVTYLVAKDLVREPPAWWTGEQAVRVETAAVTVGRRQTMAASISSLKRRAERRFTHAPTVIGGETRRITGSSRSWTR
jgi:hypothetical protein